MVDKKSCKQAIGKVWETAKRIVAIIGVLCNILTLVVVINSSDKTLADIGVASSQLKMAEEYKANHDYSNALNMYKKVLSKDDENKYYAAYNIGRIYSEYLSEKDYQKAWEYYTITISSDDIDILKWCLSFVMEQYKLYKNESQKGTINVLDDSNANGENQKSNIQIVKDLLNRINKVDSGFADTISSELPISTEEQVSNLFSSIWETTTNYWEYVLTKYSNNGAEAFENEKEKLVLVDTYQELVSETSFSTVTVYKYFRYKAVKVKKSNLSVLEVMENYYNDKREPMRKS